MAADANAEMLALNFWVGCYASHKTKSEKWGSGVVDAISVRLQKEMPGLRGLSGKSIRKIRQFFETLRGDVILPPVAAKLEPDIIDAEICSPASADKPYVEYATRDCNKPLGVATCRTADEMPENLRRALPPIDELRKQLEIGG